MNATLNTIADELAAVSSRRQFAEIDAAKAKVWRSARGLSPICPVFLLDLFSTDRDAAWFVLSTFTTGERINAAIEVAEVLRTRGCEKAWDAIADCWDRRLCGAEVATC